MVAAMRRNDTLAILRDDTRYLSYQNYIDKYHNTYTSNHHNNHSINNHNIKNSLGNDSIKKQLANSCVFERACIWRDNDTNRYEYKHYYGTYSDSFLCGYKFSAQKCQKFAKYCVLGLRKLFQARAPLTKKFLVVIAKAMRRIKKFLVRHAATCAAQKKTDALNVRSNSEINKTNRDKFSLFLESLSYQGKVPLENDSKTLSSYAFRDPSFGDCIKARFKDKMLINQLNLSSPANALNGPMNQSHLRESESCVFGHCVFNLVYSVLVYSAACVFGMRPRGGGHSCVFGLAC